MLVSPIADLTVTEFVSAQQAIGVGKQIKEFLKKIETTRKSLVEPLNKQVKAINDYAKDIAFPLINAENHVKKQLTSFEIEQEKLRQIAHKKAEEERLKKEAELKAKQENELDAAAVFGASPEELTALETKAKEELAVQKNEALAKKYDIEEQGIKNARKTWKCEAVDLSQVPKEFLIVTLNEKAVLAAARAGVTTIAGVKIWQETSIALGSNTYVPRSSLM